MPRKAQEKPVVETPRRRTRGSHQVVSEQAAAYGVKIPTENTSDERFLSPNDIGKILNVTGEAVKQWIYRRRLPAIKLANGYWKVRVVDFEAFLRARHDVGRRHVLVTGSGRDSIAEAVATIDKLGHLPVVAHNYADALLKALDHYPALFIIQLTPGDGEPWRFAEKIRATKALKNFPILFIADKELTEADADRALELSAQGLLTRPYTVDTLSQEIERILNRTM